MGMGRGGSRQTMSEINVTPLVDVMLVLMIIFMVTAPLIQQGVEVDLPQSAAQPMPANEEISVLTLTSERRIFLGEAEIPYAELREKLTHNRKLQKDKELYLHADRNLPYGVVVDVMAIVKESGVATLGMVTDPLSKPTEKK